MSVTFERYRVFIDFFNYGSAELGSCLFCDDRSTDSSKSVFSYEVGLPELTSPTTLSTSCIFGFNRGGYYLVLVLLLIGV